MKQLVFVTGNKNKFTAAQHFCNQRDIKITQLTLDIDEIQGEDGEKIIRNKALRAYELGRQPAVISDHYWAIPGLNGFPGAYMKSVSHWFTTQNFIDLTHSLTDRRAILTEYLAYVDNDGVTVFSHDHYGKILRAPQGATSSTWEQMVTMDGNNNLSIAEVFEQNNLSDAEEVWQAWEDFTKWYLAH